MQTFLPMPNFRKSAEVLDYQRLGNQRNEALTVYRTIRNPLARAWRNHPCTRMWSMYSEALAMYYNEIVEEWERRGYNNNMKRLPINQNLLKYPPWLGHTEFHSSHRAALLYKNPRWYHRFGWTEHPKIQYIWPIYDERSTIIDAFGELQ